MERGVADVRLNTIIGIRTAWKCVCSKETAGERLSDGTIVPVRRATVDDYSAGPTDSRRAVSRNLRNTRMSCALGTNAIHEETNFTFTRYTN